MYSSKCVMLSQLQQARNDCSSDAPNGHLVVATPDSKRGMTAHPPGLISYFHRHVLQKVCRNRIELIPKHKIMQHQYAIGVGWTRENVKEISS